MPDVTHFPALCDASGSLEVGRRADFVLLDDDPTKDIKNVRKVAIVIKDGHVVAGNEVQPQVQEINSRPHPRQGGTARTPAHTRPVGHNRHPLTVLKRIRISTTPEELKR